VTNYRNGANLERAAKRYLEDNGYYVTKSGGSKGVVDLVALKPGEVLLVQCKTDGYLAPAERTALRQLALRLNATALAGRWAKEGRAARTVGFAELVSMEPAGNRPWTPDHALDIGAC
jgi:hypothetical protein